MQLGMSALYHQRSTTIGASTGIGCPLLGVTITRSPYAGVVASLVVVVLFGLVSLAFLIFLVMNPHKVVANKIRVKILDLQIIYLRCRVALLRASQNQIVYRSVESRAGA